MALPPVLAARRTLRGLTVFERPAALCDPEHARYCIVTAAHARPLFQSRNYSRAVRWIKANRPPNA